MEIGFDPLPYSMARWLRAEDEKSLKRFIDRNNPAIVLDRDERPVLLAESAWELNCKMDRAEGVEFLATREPE